MSLALRAFLERMGARAMAGAEGVRGLAGWRRSLAAAGFGAAGVLGFAPVAFTPALLAAYGALVLLLDGAARGARPVRSAAWTGWAFGFGQFLAGLYWVGYAFTVDAAAHAWLLPFVAVLFPGGLALFPAAAAALAMWGWRPGWRRAVLLAGALAAFEWLRGNILTGFPWNLAGYSWIGALDVMQSVSLFGIYALGFLTLLFGASLALLFDRTPFPARFVIPAIAAFLFAGFAVSGSLRLAENTGTVSGVRLRIVQPGVPQDEKYRPEFVERNWRRLVELGAMHADAKPTHIVWPEAAPPFLLSRVPGAMGDIAALTKDGAVLMTGAVRLDGRGDAPAFYNSFIAFGPGGVPLWGYDKFHLVPFGEYLPFESALEALGITKIVGGQGGFSSGAGPRTFTVPGAPPVGPLICYEVIFPGEVAATPRPQWFVNVTDDSWFGPSTGPYQHLAIARTRAIEEGVPVVRAANTGISAVIDPMGRVIASLALGRMGALDAELPHALAPTPYTSYGNFWFFLMLALAGGVLLPLERLRRGHGR